ncbi:hypothetical protein EYZ11_004856 [Aspergillus tanneri]|uniref:Phosphoglycerate mutase family protein n=1 Tax=Aspergillus tanneri TaxID=1220188 RepID=A0A4S3JJK5_9EURO|nr:hypothetical protein EYZ11_004856 [Aspergillus tanneri]
MGNPPTKIIIVRHGARLDAADKNWHLTSPTPYDPPLSYGGWIQSRTLGAQIITLLQSSDDEPLPQEKEEHKLPSFRPQPARRKRRVIIHSSPYLRCLQTAIAVSSGISQHYPDTDIALSPKPPAINYPRSHSAGNGRVSVHGFNVSTAVPNISANDHRCLLRVDACLGEWLHSGYFEDISPPPKSERMVAAAKAELLRRDSIVPDADINSRPSVGHFPGGWGRSDIPRLPSMEEKEEQTKPSPDSDRGGRREQRSRAASYDSMQSADTPVTQRIPGRIDTSLSPIPDGLYAPPTPSYAISPSEPIPTGYVSHARDACVMIDYQWDSMREPQAWGSGGEYEEEWSTMDTRFRVGLERMISWYQNHDLSIPYNRPRRHSQLSDSTGDASAAGDRDESIETVLIIVTHGAGCNSLISAIKGETTLVNVGTASLTLAVLKDGDKSATKSSAVGGPFANGRNDRTFAARGEPDHVHPILSYGSNIPFCPLVPSPWPISKFHLTKFVCDRALDNVGYWIPGVDDYTPLHCFWWPLGFNLSKQIER